MNTSCIIVTYVSEWTYTTWSGWDFLNSTIKELTRPFVFCLIKSEDVKHGKGFFGPFYSVCLLACFCSLHLATPVSLGTGLCVMSLVLVWVERLSSRFSPDGWGGWWSLVGSCICHFSPAPFSRLSLHLCPWLSCIPGIHMLSLPCQKRGRPVWGLWMCRCLHFLRCLFGVWPYSFPFLVGESHVAPYVPRSIQAPFRMSFWAESWRKMLLRFRCIVEFSGGFPYWEHQFPPYAMVDGYSWEL